MIDPIELQPPSRTDKVKSTRISMGGRKQLVFRLVDDKDRPVNLQQEPVNPPAPKPDFQPQPLINPNIVSVRLRAVDEFYDGCPQFDVEGTILADDCKGLVSFQLDQSDTRHPGIYKAEVGRFIGSGVNRILIDTWQVFIAVEPTAFIRLNENGPLTIPEIRLSLGDLNIEEVSLLDALEFTDAEIMFCIRQVIDIWNETPPPIYRFTVHNFPYRYHWIRGTGALLYKIAAKKYARNQLNYQAGGITIDDQNKQQQYTAIAQELDQEFRQWMIHKKVQLNMDLAWSDQI
jgi:hypothetical protein